MAVDPHQAPAGVSWADGPMHAMIYSLPEHSTNTETG